MLVGVGERGTTVGFTAFSTARLPARQVPAAVLSYLLRRNANPFVAWQMCLLEGGEVGFACSYRLPAAGLHPGVFKLLCETLVAEARQFDAKMDDAGLLQ